MIGLKAAKFSLIAAGLVLGATLSHAQTDTHAAQSATEHSGSLGIPKAMQVEHEALHSELVQLTKAGGRTGEAAQRVAHVLEHHFKNENEYALPPRACLFHSRKGNLIAA